jgi:SHS2 domain-containing protein
VTYRWVDHTAELELELEAGTAEAIFEEAASAFGELVGRGGGEPAARRVELIATDRATLLADWLEELVFLADVDGFVPERVRELVLRDASLAATVEGVLGSPAPLVKAVTYHGLELKEERDGWRARVVLDV